MLEEAERFGLQCSFVSKEPPILLIGMDIGETGYRKFRDGTVSVRYLSEIVGPNGHIIINPWWSVVDNSIWSERLADIKDVAALSPGAFHFFCNTEREAQYLRVRNFDAILLNHNTFCNENVFTVMNSTREYSAIYNAKITPFKRHQLARKLSNLALIYSRYGDKGDYFRSVQSMLPKATFLNGDPSTSSYKVFDSKQVAEALNRARVGLCLSQTEGAMYASIEYLLCGLPVVSTRSEGGREVFFDSRFCVTVDDDPDAVAAAVDNLIGRSIDPNFIRAETLNKLLESRSRFAGFIDNLQEQSKEAPDGRQAFERMMSGPWSCWTYKSIGDIRKYFER